jgi:acyl-CoA thioesterase-1
MKIHLAILAVLALLANYMHAQSPIRVVCVGNSITEGYGLANSGVEGYPARLGALLGPGYSVMNAGVSGKTMFKNSVDSYWLTGRLEDAVAFDPHIVIIKLGTNDSDPKRWDVYKDEFYDDYVSMVQEFRKNGKNPIIFAAYCAPLFANAEQDYNIKNEIIPLIDSIREDQDLYSLDFYNNLLSDKGLFPDGVHPNAEGASKIAQISFDAIKAIDPQTNSSIIVNGSMQAGNVVSVNVGDDVELKLESADGTWSWTGPNGFTSTSREFNIYDFNAINSGGYIVIVTYDEGCTTTLKFDLNIESTNVSIAEDGISSVKEVKLFPNPTSGNFVLTNIPGNTNISVIDILGVEQIAVKTSGNNKSLNINIDSLPTGKYIIRVENEIVKSFSLLKE